MPQHNAIATNHKSILSGYSVNIFSIAGNALTHLLNVYSGGYLIIIYEHPKRMLFVIKKISSILQHKRSRRW